MQQDRVILVLGGARSGKSRYAEDLAQRNGGAGRRIYIATAEARDDEMRARIAEHQARRGAEWATVEAPLDLPGAIAEAATPGTTVLVDCLTLWLANLLGANHDIAAETDRLIAALAAAAGRVVVVSNEVGWGIVPGNAAARVFRDHAGWMNQAVAAAADRVVLVVAGLPMVLKGRRNDEA